MKQIYILTKLFNVHDRLASLRLCQTIDQWIYRGELKGFTRCFLPYRDSNEQVKNKPNQTLEIYKLDCKRIAESTILIGYFDGPIYDSGIGYEIGYAYILAKPVYLLTSDYFKRWNPCWAEPKSISSLVGNIATVVHISEGNKYKNDYENNQLDLRLELCTELKKQICTLAATPCPTFEISGNTLPKRTFLVDSAFTETESSRLVLERIKDTFHAFGVSYHVLSSGELNDVNQLTNYIDSSLNILVYCDAGFDSNIDSAVIQGMASALKKKIWLYASGKTSLYQTEDFILKRNPMIWHSAHVKLQSISELEHNIESGEIINENL